MFLASWFPAPLFHRAPGLNKGRRQSGRQPTRSRPFLEHLEERTLLDATNGVIGATNPAFNSAPSSIGIVLPAVANFGTTGVTTQEFPTAGGETNLAVTSDILLYTFGFGSGTQPNAPWAPAAYNLGLANHQYGYLSQTDLGFSATPPWFHRTAQSLPQEQSLDAEEGADLMPESPLLHQATKDHGQDEQRWMDEDAHDKSEDKTAPTEKPAVEEQTKPEEAALDWTRSDPAIEDALFSEPLHTLTAAAVANHRDHAAPTLANAKHTAASNENQMEGSAAEDGSIPSSLWISALTPAQMAALVAGMPGVEAPAEGCEAAIGSASE